jgi:hypothetical protein
MDAIDQPVPELHRAMPIGTATSQYSDKGGAATGLLLEFQTLSRSNGIVILSFRPFRRQSYSIFPPR